MTGKALVPADIPGFEYLTTREQAFISHPDVMKHPIAVAIEVGFAPATAKSKAHSMRKRLLRFIEPIRVRAMENAQVSLARVAEELKAIALANIDEYQEWLEVEVDGGFEMQKVYKDPDTLTQDQRRAIMRIEYTTITFADGTSMQADRPSDVVLYPKDKALKELREMFPKVVPEDPAKEQSELFDHMDPKELELITRIYDRAEKRRTNNLKPAIEAKHVETKVVAPDPGASAPADKGERVRSRTPPRNPPADAGVPPRKRESPQPRALEPAPRFTGGDASDEDDGTPYREF